MNLKARVNRLENHTPLSPVPAVVIMNPEGEYSLNGVPITSEKLDEIGLTRPVRVIHIINAPGRGAAA